MASARTLPLDYELTIYIGATFQKEFRWLPDGATTMDFTGWSASLLIGQPNAKDELVALTDANGGIALTNDGIIHITVSAVQTAALPAGVLSYSLDLADPGGVVQRFLRGRLSVVYDVGRAG